MFTFTLVDELKENTFDMEKKILRIVTACFLLFIVLSTGCSDGENEPVPQLDNETIKSDSEAEAIFDEIDGFATEGILLTLAEGRTKDNRFFIPECAEIEFNLESKKIIIDFGDGCEGRGGNVHSGVVSISYTAARFLPGSEITTTFDNYAVNGNKVEGTRVVTNISDNIFGNPKFQVQLTDGKITFTDNTTITREVNATREWIRTSNFLTDQFVILAQSVANGTTRKGESYSSIVIENLVYDVECALDKVFLPSTGKKEITVDETLYRLDFGDGSCDNILNITFNGISVELDLSQD